jgi:hypothetical protein
MYGNRAQSRQLRHDAGFEAFELGIELCKLTSSWCFEGIKSESVMVDLLRDEFGSAGACHQQINKKESRRMTRRQGEDIEHNEAKDE